MRRVGQFAGSGTLATETLNDWLRDHPEVTLVGIKPIMSEMSNITTIFAIVEMPEMPETVVENKNVENKKVENKEKE